MPNIRDVINRVKENKQAQYEQKYMLCTLVPIDSATSCRVANRANYVWVREYNNPNNTFIAFAPNTQDSINLPVYVTRNKQPPHFKRRVVEIDYSRIADDGSINDNFEGHGATHEWAAGNPGNDVFDVYSRAIYPMALRRSAGLYIYITPGIYRYRGESHFFNGELIDVSVYLPAAGNAVRICLYVVAETGTTGVVLSAEVAASVDPAYPLSYTNTIPVGWIKLLSTTTTIMEADIDDPRAFLATNELPSWPDILHRPEYLADDFAFHENEDGEFYALTAKNVTSDTDVLVIEDSQDNFSKKRVPISSLPGGTGGGISTFSDTFANRPAAGNAGNIFFPTDGASIQRDTGALWAPWGPVFPLSAPPALSGFTWVNQGTAVADELYGGIHLLAPAVSGDQLRILKKAAPAAPYTITLMLLPHIHIVDYNMCGFVWRQSSDGKLCTFMFSGENGGTLRVAKWTNATTYSALYMYVQVMMRDWLWLRITDNNTNRICSWSVDGQHFHTLHTVGRTDYLTADEVGFFAQSQNGTYPAGMRLLSWAQS